MATSTFSGRADTERLAFANALTQKEHGVSFGKYCSTALLDTICSTKELPTLNSQTDGKRKDAIEHMKAFAKHPHNAEIGSLDDNQIKDLIASRYEH